MRGVLTAVLFASGHARAVDPFEIQVYDGTASAPGTPGLELHANSVLRGQRSAPPPEAPSHHQTHLTLEPSFGLLPWWEVGAYLQSALLRDGTFLYAGSKLRSKFITPPGWHRSLRLGVNVELALLPERIDRGRVGAEVRPIVAWENDRWLFAANPNLGVPLTRPDLADGPSFEPALMALYKWEGQASVGFEYYAGLGPVVSPSPLAAQEHYLYEVVNVLAIPNVELNVGFGHGFTDAGNTAVGKLIVGYSWEREGGPPAVDASPIPRGRR